MTDGLGEPLDQLVPEIEAHLPVEDSTVIAFEDREPIRYFLCSESGLKAGQTTIGNALVLTDVTQVENQRREIESQRAQMDDFSKAITHELRNTITIVDGHLNLAQTQIDPETTTSAVESVSVARETIDRMQNIVRDLATLAKFGATVEETTDVEIASVAREAWESVATDDHRLTVSNEATVGADRTRLERLFVNLFEFMTANGATEVTLSCLDDGFVVTGDGKGLAETEIERVFAYGDPIPDAETGMLLPIVRTLAEAHEWTATIDTDYRDGVQLRIKY